MTGQLHHFSDQWTPGEIQPAFSPPAIAKLAGYLRKPLVVIPAAASQPPGVAIEGTVGSKQNGEDAYPVTAILPPLPPEKLGAETFKRIHDTRFSYIAGAMANGISSPLMVANIAKAGGIGFFGAGGLGFEAVEKGLSEITSLLEGMDLPWGTNLLAAPNEPELEQRVAELYLRSGVRRISASGYVRLSPALVKFACTGLTTDAQGRIRRRNFLFAKTSRPEVARLFMSPAPEAILSKLKSTGQLGEAEAALGRKIPLSEDIVMEADSGGHTDKRSLTVLLPAAMALRDELMLNYPDSVDIRVGAAGGLGTPEAVAAAFAAGAAFVLTGSINQATVESGQSAIGKDLLLLADFADTTMAPAPDMFEQGAKVQVLSRGTRYANRANELYDLYTTYGALEEIPREIRTRLEEEVFRTTIQDVWRQTADFFEVRSPAEVEKARKDPKHQMALVFRWYLGHSSLWAIAGERSRQQDFQIWCGPSQGAFNAWARGSFLAEGRNRTVEQVALNMMEGAALIMRGQQLRQFGIRLPRHDLNFKPRVLTPEPYTSEPEQTAETPAAVTSRATVHDRIIRPPRLKQTEDNTVAVIGISCWYPGARNPRQLWENIVSRRRQFRLIPNQRLPLSEYFDADKRAPDKTYGDRAAVIDGFEFDWAGHRIPISSFESTDIVQWLALDVALKAVEDAGYGKDSLPSEQTGVIVGNTLNGDQSRAYPMRLRWPFVRKVLRQTLGDLGAESEAELEAAYKSVFASMNEDSLAGGLPNVIAGRICNYLDLNGGGYIVDGACASSLLAVTTAISGLVGGDMDLVLAGGVDLNLDAFELVGFSKTQALTSGDMTVYDRKGSGFIPGEGCGFVVLKRLADAKRDGDFIYAVVRGWGVSSDGGGTGITAPSAMGQSRALKRAYQRAPYEMTQLNFIEGHGTGTRAGDQAELKGIVTAMGNGSAPAIRSCGMTSIKSIIGHCKAAAGIGGFIKAAMAVNRRVVPPTAACSDPHPIFEAEAQPLYPVRLGKVHGSGEILRAGVSAMGFGGINCHVTLESASPPNPKLAPAVAEQKLLWANQESEVFLFSADDIAGMTQQVEAVRSMAPDISLAEMADLSADLIRKLDSRASLRAAVCAAVPKDLTPQLDSLLELLKSPSQTAITHRNRSVWLATSPAEAKIGMLFPGQGSQKLNMARVLYERFDWARDLVSRADELSTAFGLEPLSGYIFRDLDRAENAQQVDEWSALLAQTEIAQPAITLASMLWYRFLTKLGLCPSVVGGHSLGELSAFQAAGAFDRETLLKLALLRGRSMKGANDRPGAMLSLMSGREQAQEIVERIEGYVVLANINSPRQMILSGEVSAIEAAQDLAAREGIAVRRLPVSNAFHSRLAANAATVLEREAEIAATFEAGEPRLFTSTDGREIQSGLDLRTHFAGQVLHRVDFIGLVHAMAQACDVMIEVGPGRVLSNLAADIMAAGESFHCLPVESRPGQDRDLNQLCAALFAHGLNLDWEALFEGRLIRSFTPPAELRFIDNPCERPIQGGSTPAPIGVSAALAQTLSLASNLPADQISAYLQNRGAFLAQVMQADLNCTPPEGFAAGAATSLPAVPPATENPDSGTTVTEPADASAKPESFQAVLFDKLEALTGFPQDMMSLDSRLLDDLNLDSIKATDLIVDLAEPLGMVEQLDPQRFANATLAEICEAFEAAMGRGQPLTADTSKPDVLSIVRDELFQLTGYPPEALNPAAIMASDLNLDEDKLAGLIQRCESRLAIEVPVDLEPLAEKSIDQIAGILTRVMSEQETAPPIEPKGDIAGQIFAHDPTWVRDFKTVMVPQVLAESGSETIKRWTDDLKNARGLVLFDGDQQPIADAIREALFRHGADVRLADQTGPDSTEGPVDPVDKEYTHLFIILPQSVPADTSHPQRVQRLISRIVPGITVPAAAMSRRRNTSVVFIQFGGGRFGAGRDRVAFDSCCTKALAASLHLERKDLRVRVLDFPLTAQAEGIADCSLAELRTPDAFAAVGFNAELERFIPRQEVVHLADRRPREIEWIADDVILVTGGAKGITASCTYELARSTGARMALLGSSPHPAEEPDHKGAAEIQKILQRYEARGLTARYYCCDVTDANAVRQVAAQIRAELGPVSGVVHGAGLNRPRPLNQATADEALAEIGPKLLGVLNLIETLRDDPLKLFMGLSSIIGVTGMPGNGWYGFANEALSIILHQLQLQHQQIAVQSVAFSIWGDEGMGVRLGSVSRLKQMGIEAIPSEPGIGHFVDLALTDPGSRTVVVAARLAGLDTWRTPTLPCPSNLRYLEKKIHLTPGVEGIAACHLDLDSDPYLKDHLFNGSYLLPTVFGLEAMAQAAAWVTGRHDFSRLDISRISLERPITVAPEKGTDILIHARVVEKGTDPVVQVVNAGIFTSRTVGTGSHFSATFTFGVCHADETVAIPINPDPLDIEPKTDLYSSLFFQGPLFQRIARVHAISAAEGDVGHTALLALNPHQPETLPAKTFPHKEGQSLLLGDPYIRDTLLQAAQLVLPQETSLPVSIDNISIRRIGLADAEQPLFTHVRIDRIEGREIHCTVSSFDAEGSLYENLTGYRLKTLAHHEDFPTIRDMLNPDRRDNRNLNERLADAGQAMAITLPAVRLCNMAGLHDLPPDERHARELPLMEACLQERLQTTDPAAVPPQIGWAENGKPFIAGQDQVDWTGSAPDQDRLAISLAHDERMCMVATGRGPQGCDLAPVIPRDRDRWLKLLNLTDIAPLDQMVDGGEDLNRAATRLWTAMESFGKATGRNGASFKLLTQDDDAICFDATDDRTSLTILTLPVAATRGPLRMMATVVQPQLAPSIEAQPSIATQFESLVQASHFDLLPEGPQGQLVIRKQFPVTFKPNAQKGGTLYFPTFFYWMGELRETSIWPTLGQIAEQFSTGQYGAVTNHTRLQILGDATTPDMIEGRLWVADVGGPQGSTLTLTFDWRKLLSGGRRERIAWSEQQTTWVRILDHGVVEAEPFPDYFQKFVDQVGPPAIDSPQIGSPDTVPQLDPLPEPWAQLTPGSGLYTAPAGPIVKPLLKEYQVDTSLLHANLVGNIYYAHYYDWQAHMRDHYLYQAAPELMLDPSNNTTFVCRSCGVKHLREAMPFDRIVVTMALKTLAQSGFGLYFEYFRLDPDGQRRKLAYGEQEVVCVLRNGDGRVTERNIPAPLMEHLNQAISFAH